MTTQTLTLTEFILQRIAEDEAWVSEHFAGVTMGIANPADHFVPIPGSMDRVLAECEAKRQIVERLDPAFGNNAMFELSPLAEWISRTLAVVYADHAGYREEWRP